MQKHPEHQHHPDTGVPLLTAIIIGLLFFGSYLAAERLSQSTMPSPIVALGFLLGYLLVNTALFIFFLIKNRRARNERTLFESLNSKMHTMFKYMVKFPYAITDDQGRIRATNSALQDLIGAKNPFYRGSLADLCDGTSLRDILDAASTREQQRHQTEHLDKDGIAARAEVMEEQPEATLPVHQTEDGLIVTLKNGRRYNAVAYRMEMNRRTNYLVTFTDISELFDLKEKTEREMPAVAYIDVDNLEELTQYTRTNYRDASRKVDDILIRWAASVNGLLREYERDRYLLLFSQEKLIECERDKFTTLLDEIREVRLGEYKIPVTISVGISLSDGTMAERAKDADTALDMALQRGGDQVAVRRKSGIQYYGGQNRPTPRRTKVQSRVVANYLLHKISESENVLIMGHKNPDFDSIGACIGMAQMSLFAGVPTHIIIDSDNPNLKTATERLIRSRIYSDMFISGHEGMDLIRPTTLLILVDVNNFFHLEDESIAKNVLSVSGRIAIIDHHLQTKEYNFEPVLNYIDTTASSACELVTEMLEQTDLDIENTKLVSDTVANAILAGIMLDTVNFTRNTGNRTLDAARYLFDKGARSDQISKFFTGNYVDYVCERSFFACSLMQNGTVGLTWSNGTGHPSDDRIAAAKEADKLLSIKGVHASFALVVVEGAVHISARSDGMVNVQQIAERLGGGGRFDTAGVSMKDTSLEKAIADLRKAIGDHFREHGEADTEKK